MSGKLPDYLTAAVICRMGISGDEEQMTAKNDIVKSAIRIIVLYAIFASLWIAVSDRILAFFVADTESLTQLQTYKGWAFVGVSSVLLYLFVRRELRRRELTERALQKSEEKYRKLIETANDPIVIADAVTGVILDANRKAEVLFCSPSGGLKGMHQYDLHPPRDAERYKEIFREAVLKGNSVSEELVVCCRDGKEIPVEISANTIDLGGKKIIQGVFRDISVHKRAEAELQKERDKAQQYLNVAGVILLVIDGSMNVSLINRKGCEILGYPEDEIIGRNWFDHFIPERLRAEMKEVFSKLVAGQIELYESFENPVLTRSGEERIVAWHNSLLKDDKGAVVGTLSSGEDITARKKAEEQANYRLQRLSALHSIDMVISASLDLRVTLEEFIDQVISQLKVDAADVLLLNHYTQILEYATRRGFRSPAVDQLSLRLGQGIAGRAALERQIISIQNLHESTERCKRLMLFRKEEFITYHAIPLIAKGQVKGVLEIMHRSLLEIDEEGRNFLDSLAAQAAIAIDNASLFDDLQRSNIELTLAYDATLEGWARALDLRSKETEQHTERVTEMTLRLARAMGMSDKELMHIRRGALLHDIGKIGVPDRILQKTGQLTEGEWQIMRRHPVYAFEMLLPIAYLRPALDIPYCHHEKWDGTGYPRSLKGEQIPLSARIFAVVDVWDALYSENRPYRQALPEKEVRTHIRSLAGSHLDPDVVEQFLKLEW